MEHTHTANPVRVKALRIAEIEHVGTAGLILTLDGGLRYKPSAEQCARIAPQVGDYLVTQEDGYEYLNPKDVFERKYSAVARTAPAKPPVAAISADDAFEAEIKAKGLTAPRITPKDLAAAIASEHYFTAEEGVRGATGTLRLYEPDPLALLTFCVLVLQNGFTVVGKSACASPQNFDAEMGRKIARQDAVSQMWPLLGYALKERLHAATRAAEEVLATSHP